ncbi:MAG: hypothetical protein EOO92_09495 [Pedobacter sp.]|nr:MAG: hypothetical protein EOO92_09495 [Pedobacter sp.]
MHGFKFMTRKIRISF